MLAEVDAAQANLVTAMTPEIRWSFYLNDLSLTIPRTTRLTTHDRGQRRRRRPAGPAAPPTTSASHLSAQPTMGSITFTGKSTGLRRSRGLAAVTGPSGGYLEPVRAERRRRRRPGTRRHLLRRRVEHPAEPRGGVRPLPSRSRTVSDMTDDPKVDARGGAGGRADPGRWLVPAHLPEARRGRRPAGADRGSRRRQQLAGNRVERSSSSRTRTCPRSRLSSRHCRRRSRRHQTYRPTSASCRTSAGQSGVAFTSLTPAHAGDGRSGQRSPRPAPLWRPSRWRASTSTWS